MKETVLIVLIILGLVGLFLLWKWLKPYVMKYDTTICVVGGLGSGKSLTSVKKAVVLIRRQRFIKYYCYNFFVKIGNGCKKFINRIRIKNNVKRVVKGKPNKPLLILKNKRKKPMLYSNIPIHFKQHFWTKNRDREWCKQLKASHLLCMEELREYSVVVVDELPQFINQFNWNEELIQKNVNEFITYFRHYVAGYFIVNAQSIDDVVVQIRRKLNQATWCFDFRKHLLGLFYTIRCCDIMLSDQVGTISTTFIEDNTKLQFGLFPPKKTYDTRCYSERYKNIYQRYQVGDKFSKIKTNKVLRLMKYTSPLDDTTTKLQKEEQWKKGETIWKN